MAIDLKDHDLFHLDGDSDNEDIISEYSEVIKQSKSQNYQNEQNIEILTASDVTDLMKETLCSVQEIMCIPITTLRLLLNFYKWDSVKMLESFYTAGEEDMFHRAGLKPVSKEKIESISSSECEICCLPSSDFASLSCGHGFCLSCWEEHFTVQIVDQGVSQQMECPGAECQMYVEDQFVEKVICNPAVLDKYWLLINDKFVAYNRELAWCPSPHCTKAVKVELSRVMAVVCSCGCSFCFRCGRNYHDAVPCRLVDRWEKMEDGNYFDEVLTRDCPGCGMTIERNGGCNNITCIKCKRQFCWWCLESHNNHDTNVCSKHTVTETEMAILARNEGRQRFNALRERRQILEKAVGTCVLADKLHVPPFPKAGKRTVQDHLGRLAAMQRVVRNNNVGFLRRRRGWVPDQVYQMELLLEDEYLGDEGRFQMRRMALENDMRRMALGNEEDELNTSDTENLQFNSVLSEIKYKMNISWDVFYSMERANEVMIKAQKTLVNMQVFANFLPSTPNAEVFEINLEKLEDAVTRISVSLKKIQDKVHGNESEEILESVDKLELEDSTRFCENRRSALEELVKEGPEASGWLFTI